MSHMLAASGEKTIRHTNSYRIDGCHNWNTGIYIYQSARWIWATACRWYSNRVRIIITHPIYTLIWWNTFYRCNEVQFTAMYVTESAHCYYQIAWHVRYKNVNMKNHACFEVLIAVVMKISVFWDIMLCSSMINFHWTSSWRIILSWQLYFKFP